MGSELQDRDQGWKIFRPSCDQHSFSEPLTMSICVGGSLHDGLTFDSLESGKCMPLGMSQPNQISITMVTTGHIGQAEGSKSHPDWPSWSLEYEN